MRLIGLLTVLILLSGCFLFRSEVKPEDRASYTERLSRPRTERQLERRELVLAVHDGIESTREISLLRSVLEKQQIRLRVIRIADRDALSAIVRSGRADLMAGSFSAGEIRSLHLLPVLPYAGSDGKRQFCFAVRHDDHILEGLLGEGSAVGNNAERNEK